MNKRSLISLSVLFIPAVLAGCGSSGGASGGGGTSSNAAATVPVAKISGKALAVSNTSLGRVLVDSRGRTLYAFGHDLTNHSRCSGACAMNWPPATASRHPKVGAGISKNAVRVIHRSGGGLQLSYAGHPLYRFALDARAGDVKGQGVNAFGGIWHVLSHTGTVVTRAPATTQPPASTTPSGGGYGSGY